MNTLSTGTVAARALRAVTLAIALIGVAACSSIVPGADRDPPKLYDLSPKSTFSPKLPKAQWQLVVEPPVAAAGLSSARIALKRQPLRLEYYAKVSWTDTTPKMVQTLVIESFENTNKIVSVGRTSAGLRSDYVLKTGLREFQAEYMRTKGRPRIRVRISAKLVRMPQRTIIASKSFERIVSAKSNKMDAIVNAYDNALGKVLKKLVEWSLVEGQRSWKLLGPRRRRLFSRYRRRR